MDLLYKIKLCNNVDYDRSLELVVLIHKGVWVVLMIKLYENNKVVSTIYCLL